MATAKKQSSKASGFRVIKKRNGRFAVMNRGGGYVRGEDKVKVLLERKLIKLAPPKAPAEASAPAEEAAAESAE